MKENVYGPGECIFEKDSFDNIVYFLLQKEVVTYYQLGNKIKHVETIKVNFIIIILFIYFTINKISSFLLYLIETWNCYWL